MRWVIRCVWRSRPRHCVALASRPDPIRAEPVTDREPRTRAAHGPQSQRFVQERPLIPAPDAVWVGGDTIALVERVDADERLARVGACAERQQ